ncbi:MAG: DUF4139 domain-containing protein [Gammaproteobacteria bacterium]|nr:DUF4139 domain-containing protein [Gammaproteobacteria bacterium]
MKSARLLLTAFLFLAGLSGLPAEELRSTQADQTGVAVTIYNQDLALVKDRRQLTLTRGEVPLAYRDVSARIRPETALLRSLSHPGSVRVLEQNFDFDLLSPQKLLEKYVGRRVRVARINPATGLEQIEQATVLSTNQGVVLRYVDRIENSVAGRLIFDEVPANLRDRPTLVTLLQSSRGGSQEVELSYLTGGLAWKADYVAELNADDTALDLAGWVTLTNQSGSRYENARLQLVAGDLNRVQPERKAQALMEMSRGAAVDSAAPMAEEGLFEYHLYTLARPTTIADNQTKQVALLNAASVPVSKQLLLQGNDYYYRSSYGEIGQKLKVAVFIELVNDEKSHMGMPLPKGIVRVYKQDRSGNAQFVGEDQIDHTPKNEAVRMKLGDAFDVTASKVQIDYQKRGASGRYSQAHESAYRIELKNAKSEAVTVTVREPVPGDWKMLEASAPHQRVAAGTAEWQLEVPAEGSRVLEYRVLVRW